MDIYKRIFLAASIGVFVGAIVGGLSGTYDMATWNISNMSEVELQAVITNAWMFGIGVGGTISLLTYICTGDFIWDLIKKIGL